MEGIGNFLQNNPRFFAILAIIAGIGLFVYTLNTDAEKLFERTVASVRDTIFGGKFAVKALYFIISVVLVFAGVAFLISWRRL
jgi:hypothetical protein